MINIENDNDIDDIRSQLNFSDDELLYDKNSINILYESIELLEELRKQFKKHNPRNIERRNGMLIFDLVMKYCQYAETLGATINGFEVSNKSKNLSSSMVLSYLKNYEIGEVKDFFKEISSPKYMNLSDTHKQKLIYTFGYHKSDKNNIDDIIEHIFDLLKEIAGVYSIFVESYNASKHGHRVWYGYDLATQRSNCLLYIEKKNKDNNYTMNKVPLDDSVSSNYIIPYSKDCQKLFEMILENNNNIRRKGQI